MAIYMKFGDIEGELDVEGFKKWIQVDSMQWGVGRGISPPTRGANQRESSEPSVSEIVVTKRMDSTSGLLLKESLMGKGVKVELQIVQTGGNTVTPFQKYELTATMVSGYSISTGGDVPSESLSLNFAKIESKYLKVAADQSPQAGAIVMYDLTTLMTS
jgi:type VI secretion system secreted protein Hcp